MISAVAPEWTRASRTEGLSIEEQAQLAMLFGRILPGDAERRMPGAVEAGAVRFVSRLIAREESVYREIPQWRTLYPQALQALNEHARTAWGLALTELSAAQVDELLSGLQSGTLVLAGIDSKLLFKTLLRHCLQGCFADPRWGGNHKAMMWKAIGYPLQGPVEDEL